MECVEGMIFILNPNPTSLSLQESWSFIIYNNICYYFLYEVHLKVSLTKVMFYVPLVSGSNPLQHFLVVNFIDSIILSHIKKE